MRASHQHQMRTDAPGRGVPVGGVTRRFTPAADDAQGGLHSLPVGANRRTSRLFSAPPYTCRGLHCATAFSIHVRARLAPSGAAPRRHVCILPNGRAATHSYAARGGLHRSRSFAASGFVPIRRCALARGPQFCLPEHSTRQSSDALEGHFLERLSSRAGFDTQQHSDGVSQGAEQISQGRGNV